jgi:hypothetical protein
MGNREWVMGNREWAFLIWGKGKRERGKGKEKYTWSDLNNSLFPYLYPFPNHRQVLQQDSTPATHSRTFPPPFLPITNTQLPITQLPIPHYQLPITNYPLSWFPSTVEAVGNDAG